MFDLFRLRHSDQWTVAIVLAISAVLLCGYTAVGKQETLEPKPYRFCIDLNTVTLGELQTLPGIGPKLAEGIIQYRDRHAPILDSGEILNVRGIGNKRYDTLKRYLSDETVLP